MNDSMTIQRIIEIRAERSTDTVKDLKQEINDLKDALLNVEEGTKDYDKGVQLLQEDQRRLNEVNKLTKKENVALATSYYDLNAQLVQARKDYKNLTAEQRDNAEVGGVLLTKIQDLDRQLKDLDANMGQYQRNVGDYRGALQDFGGVLSKLPEGAGATVTGLKHMGNAMKLLSTNPLMALIGIIAPILKGISGAIKENEGAMNAIRSSMELLKPVGEFINGIFEKIGEAVSSVVTWLGNLFKANAETFGAMGPKIIAVGNVIVQALLAPIKAVIAAVKGVGKIIGDIIHGDFSKIKEDAKSAGKDIAAAFKDGFDVKNNFKEGEEIGQQFVADIKAKKKPAADAAKEVAEEVKQHYMSAYEYQKYILQQQLALVQKNSEEELAIRQQQRRLEYENERERLTASIENEAEREEALRLAEEVFNAEMLQMQTDYDNDRIAEEQRLAEEQHKIAEQQRKEEEDRRKKEEAEWKKLHDAKIATTRNAFSTILSLYEAFGGEQAKESQGYKAIASAQAAVQAMLSANEAYAAMASIPYVGPALGAVAAAAALAAGMAQVRQINATNMTKMAQSTTATASAPTASVQAPAVSQQVEATRTITGAQEEERLNNAQRVYVVYDDISQAGKKVDVQTSEATF